MEGNTTPTKGNAQRRHVLMILAASILGLIFFAWVTWKPLKTAPSELVGVIGLQLSVAGLVGTAIGFYIAVRQLLAVQIASAAARDAAEGAQAKLASFNTLTEVGSALTSIRETRRHVEALNWRQAVESLTELRLSLNRIVDLSTNIEEEDLESMRSMMADAAQARDAIRGLTPQRAPRASVNSVLSQLFDSYERMSTLEIRLQRSLR